MGREHDDEPGATDAEPEGVEPGATDAEPEGVEPGATDAEPAGDSAGVYYLSIEDFEARLPRLRPDAEPAEDS